MIVYIGFSPVRHRQVTPETDKKALHRGLSYLIGLWLRKTKCYTVMFRKQEMVRMIISSIWDTLGGRGYPPPPSDPPKPRPWRTQLLLFDPGRLYMCSTATSWEQEIVRMIISSIWDTMGVQGTPRPPQTSQNCIAGEHKKGQNDYNLLTRPPIKILRPLFTLQLLILPTRDPFQAHKKLKLRAKIEVFAFKLTPSMVKPQIEVKLAKILIFCP